MDERIKRVVAIVWVVLGCVIGIGPTALLAATWESVPETVPVHWGAGLEPDRWGSRIELWLIPAICLVCVLAVGMVLAVLARRSGRAPRDVLTQDRNDATVWFVPYAVLAPAAAAFAAQLGVTFGLLESWALAVLPIVVAIAELPLLFILGDWKTLLREYKRRPY